MANDLFRTLLGRLKPGTGGVADLLAAVEPLRDGERWRQMIALGRRARTDTSARERMHALAAEPNFHPRRLALMSAYASGDPAIIEAAIVGPSRRLFGLALAPAVRHLDDGRLAALLIALPARRCMDLARYCSDARRTVAVDQAFDGLSRRAQLRVLGYCGPAFVSARLADPDVAEALAPQDWGRIAVRHPAIAADALAARLAGDEEPPHHVREAARVAILRMSTKAPAAALALLQRAATRAPLATLSYQRLAVLHPREIARLLLADRAEATPPIPIAVLRRVDDDTRLALLRLRGRGVSPDEFRRCAPAARRHLHAIGTLEAARDAAGALPVAFLPHLHGTARVAEAWRAWSAPQYGARPAARLPYLAFMRFDDAVREGTRWESQPDGELRAIADAALVAAGRFAPDQLPAILAFVEAKRNEQDPVRAAMLDALANLPPTRWTEAHLPALAAIIDAALDARDVSVRTLSHAARLAMGVTPQHIAFAAARLARITERSAEGFVRLEGRLTDAQMGALTPHVLPLIGVWLARSQTARIVGFLRSFGRRLRAAPPLLDKLVRMTADARRDVAEPALGLLVSLRVRQRTDALIPQLLADDPGWILSRTVARHLDRRRQDLLDPFLEPRVHKGRFSTGKTAVLPAFGGNFQRWTRKQQERYAEALVAVARGSKRSVGELHGTVPQLAEMPAADPSTLEALARLDNGNALLRDIALMALGRLDGGRGLPTLTAALADDRARVAIYALREALLDMPSTDALDILRRAPRRQVTVAKEVVRLAGDVPGDAARRFLAEVMLEADLHRDTRIAALRALWNDLEDEGTWQVFADAARRDQATARSTIRIPGDRLSPRARLRLVEHLALLLRHDAPQIRLETLERLVTQPVTVAGDASLTQVLRDVLARPTEAEVGQAAAALALCSPTANAASLGATLASVQAPRGLAAIVDALAAQGRARPERIAPIAQAFVDRLLDTKRHVGLATRLALDALPATAFEAVLRRLVSEGALHAGALMQALAALPAVATLRRAADLDGLEPRLAAMEPPAVRRIALEILLSRAAAQGWNAAARSRLAHYRADADPLVAEAADLVVVPDDAASGAVKSRRP